ncbi:helix-turn-helix transcriptional regulator [Paenibacillus pabuli]|uniref:helix-turn-helix transcriptional regulator n=1 Tax=Paenibacillus pabuli TaxID=1472 RepID=UPI000785BC0B|nr:AraC family transcriptional regulator [Paenibacillus pabuli]MEC0125214.1 AraC family transcriptional regulator [Paenibacillus pabuli]
MNTIFYVGYDAAHPADFIYDIPEGHDFWLLILTQTPAEFWVNGEIKAYPANCAVLYPPYQKIMYRACTDQYVNDWVRFLSDESYVLETAIPLGTPILLPDPGYCHQLFQLLATENFLQCDYRELSIDYLFRIMFNKLLEASQSVENKPHYQDLLNLRKAINHNPGQDWSVSIMADYVHLSPGYLQSLYKTTFGISCMEDVIQSRIRLAKERLIHGQSRISDISELCGYRNVEHFSRQFRQVVGCTPRSYRKSITSPS